MKILILFFLVSCAAPLYRENPNSKSDIDRFVRQCSLPIFIGSDVNLTKEMANIVSNSADHWNNITGMHLFVNLGSVNQEQSTINDAFVLVRMEKGFSMKNHIHAITNYKFDDRGCMHYTVVTLNPDHFYRGNDFLRTILRHEFGHVLGLGHIEEMFTFKKIMHPHIGMSYNHPVSVSEYETEAVKIIYAR